MIAKAVDEDGDPIGVIEPGTTYEEPYTYSPIEYKNGTLRITSKSVYNNKPEVDVISSENMMYDGVPTLQLIARMYKKAIKKSSNNQEMSTAPSQEETDANQVYEGNLNESALSPKAVEYIKNYIDKFDERAMAVKLVDIALKSVAGVESSDLPDTSTFANGVDEIQSLLEDQEYDEAYQMAKETAQEMLDEEGFGNLNEAKEPTKGGDQVNPYELEKGTYYELDCQKDGAKDTKKAKAKAIKNLNKNPKYYSDLFSKNYNDKPNTSDQMQIVKESLKNLINDILSEK